MNKHFRNLLLITISLTTLAAAQTGGTIMSAPAAIPIATPRPVTLGELQRSSSSQHLGRESRLETEIERAEADVVEAQQELREAVSTVRVPWPILMGFIDLS